MFYKTLLENKFCSGCLQSFSDDQLFEIEGQYYCKYCLPDRAPAFEEEEATIKTPLKIKKIFIYSYFFLHVLIVFVLIPIAFKYGVKSITVWWILIILNIPVFLFSFKFFLPNSKEVNMALWYSFKPDLMSLFQGELHKDLRYERLLKAPFLAAGVLIVIEYVASIIIYDFVYSKYIF